MVSTSGRPRVICHMTPSVFDVAEAGAAPTRLMLDGFERRADGVLWLRYRVVGTK